ncbi:copper amine oxidase N-terminal domain-containing protein [Saccharibacillus sacchari]|uniref:Copper amine oxidase N-terminal domain-containing protein n=1 Tax=Saccharibacillus sacchari TaxID=456493 RepID=A0ACC6PF75_9BACL
MIQVYLQDRVGELATLIGPYVEADPTAFYTYEEFQQNIAYSASEDSGGSDMELPSGEFGGTGMMASGSMMTFALNRLVNLEEQLGLTVTELPESDKSSATGTQTSTAVHVQYEGSDVVFSDVQPVVQSDRVSVPVYGLLERLNAETDWDNSTKTLTLVRNGTTSSITVGKETAVSAGQTVSLDIAATLENSRVWLSVQTLSDVLGLSVSWNENTRTLLISGS